MWWVIQPVNCALATSWWLLPTNLPLPAQPLRAAQLPHPVGRLHQLLPQHLPGRTMRSCPVRPLVLVILLQPVVAWEGRRLPQPLLPQILSARQLRPLLLRVLLLPAIRLAHPPPLRQPHQPVARPRPACLTKIPSHLPSKSTRSFRPLFPDLIS
jgi:hypothetical protein